MKKYLFGITFLCIQLMSQAQNCEPYLMPKPQMGAHIDPEFTNCWNMVNSGFGINYGSANIGSEATKLGSPVGSSMIFLGTDGWPKANKLHTFFINLDSANNRSLKVFPNDIFKCRYKGTLSQLGSGAANQTFADATLQNVSEVAGFVNFDLKVTGAKTKGKLTNIKFTVNGHIEDIQIMRPGYVLNDPRMVTDECKAWLQGLSVLRLMNLSGCNKNYEREWKYRTPANAPFMNFVDNGDGNEIKGNKDKCYDERGNNPYLANSFNQDRCYPWEKAIDLCNYLDKDFYINLPVLIDLNYARELSKLLKLRMKPSLNIYLEIGNELWNFGGGGAFHGFAMEFAAAHNMVMVQGDKTIDGGFNNIVKETETYGDGTYWTGGFGAYVAARRWPSYRLKQYMDEFAKEFGFADQGGISVRIRAVLAGQLAYNWGQDYWFIGNEALGFLEKVFGYGTTRKYIHSIGITHYTVTDYTYDKSENEILNWSVDNIFRKFYQTTNRQFGEFGMEGDALDSNGVIIPTIRGDCEGNELEDILALSKRYGVKVIAYEGGHEANYQGNGGWTPLKNMVAAYNSPKMYEHTLYTMNKWYSWMGHDALFIKNGYFTPYAASYGIAEYEGQQSPQYLAYKKIMETPVLPFARERGGVLGLNSETTVLPGWKVASYQCKDFTKNSYLYSVSQSRQLKGNKDASTDIYLLRNATSGIYSVSLTLNFPYIKPAYDVYLDGKLVKGNWNLSIGTFSEALRNTDTLKLNIPYGVHTLHFEKSEGSLGTINLQQINIALVKADPSLTVGLTPNPACNPLETFEGKAVNESNALQLFPNPATNILNVSCTTSISAIAIYHITGSKLLTTKTATAIDVSSLSDGLYLLEATDNNGNRMVKKFEKK